MAVHKLGEGYTRLIANRPPVHEALYKATEGKPRQYRMVIGLASKQTAVDYAVEKGGLLVEDEGSVRR